MSSKTVSFSPFDRPEVMNSTRLHFFMKPVPFAEKVAHKIIYAFLIYFKIILPISAQNFLFLPK